MTAMTNSSGDNAVEKTDHAEHLLPIIAYLDAETNVYWPNLKKFDYGQEVVGEMKMAVERGTVTRFADLVTQFARAVKLAAEHSLLPPEGQTDAEFGKKLRERCSSIADAFDSVSVLEYHEPIRKNALARLAFAEVDMVAAVDAYENAKAAPKLAVLK